MQNIKYDEMFNGDLKSEFINENYKTDGSKKVIANTFYKTRLTEIVLNKDLCNFNTDELAGVIVSSQLTTYNSVKSVVSLIKTYIDWTYKAKYRGSNLNLLRTVDESWIRNLIYESESPFWTKDYIYEIVDNVVDYQDKALILALFEGICGKKMSEISNLKLEHINEDNKTIKLFNDQNESRIINVSSKLIKYLKSANANTSYTGADNKTYTIVDTDYIFRIDIRNRRTKLDNKPITQMQLFKRLPIIVGSTGLIKLKSNNINRSGMLYFYHESLLKKNNGSLNYIYPESNLDLENKELENLVAGTYNWTLQTHISGSRFYNTSSQRKSFLNLETVCGLYNDNSIAFSL